MAAGTALEVNVLVAAHFFFNSWSWFWKNMFMLNTHRIETTKNNTCEFLGWNPAPMYGSGEPGFLGCFSQPSWWSFCLVWERRCTWALMALGLLCDSGQGRLHMGIVIAVTWCQSCMDRRLFFIVCWVTLETVQQHEKSVQSLPLAGRELAKRSLLQKTWLCCLLSLLHCQKNYVWVHLLPLCSFLDFQVANLTVDHSLES